MEDYNLVLYLDYNIGVSREIEEERAKEKSRLVNGLIRREYLYGGGGGRWKGRIEIMCRWWSVRV
jgi:hypothetical protein